MNSDMHTKLTKKVNSPVYLVHVIQYGADAMCDALVALELFHGGHHVGAGVVHRVLDTIRDGVNDDVPIHIDNVLP